MYGRPVGSGTALVTGKLVVGSSSQAMCGGVRFVRVRCLVPPFVDNREVRLVWLTHGRVRLVCMPSKRCFDRKQAVWVWTSN